MKLKMKKVIFLRWKDSEEREREREREKEQKRRDTLESEDGTSREKKK